tara:strand:- start:2333 stop:3637 length:1305 start_codon:yes stop_codon:yes gene_type:complete
MTNSSSLIINQPNNLTGEIFIPGDKSITHRAIMLGSLSNGRLDIKNSLLSEDCKRTIDAFIKLGVDITIDDTTISIYGKGLNALKPPCSIIDAGNSGTLARLISGVLAVQNFDSSISGDSSLVKRPMKRIIDPLTIAGANISSNNNLMPLSFKQSGKLKVINYTCLIPSAQIKSCLVLASLFLDGTSIIKETIKTRDHTERMLQFLDYPISIDDKIISINGNGTIVAKDIRIPSDISSASFLIVGALIAPNSNIILKSIGINPLRTGIIDVLIKMGADIKMVNHTNIGNEPVADIIVRSSILNPVNLSGDIISRLIDELPILFIACACCEGISVIKDIEELRHKESDRIKSMEEGLINLGIKVESTTNSIKISGGSFKGGIVNSNSDHRVAMSFLIAGLVSLKPITIIDTDNINTSFPNFVDILRDQNNEIYDL